MKIRSAASLATLCACAALALPALAQPAAQPPSKPPSPEEVKKLMEASMNAMAPAMGAMSSAMIEAQLAAAANPETAARLAAFKWNLYQALLKQGFNGQDAMRITVETSPPGASPAK